MAREKILIVEDEEDILELVSYNLIKEGYQVTGIATGEDALKTAKSVRPHLILLDLMLPGVDGLEVCKLLRADSQVGHIPILMLTAKSEEADVVAGLEVGADDYLAKPFSPKILIARVRALLRRKIKEPLESTEPIQIQDLEIHPGRHEVMIGTGRVDLTFTEFRILYLLASRPGWVYSRYQIVEAVRGDGYNVTDRAVDVQIVGLRKKLGTYGPFISTVRGVGYRFQEQHA